MFSCRRRVVDASKITFNSFSIRHGYDFEVVQRVK